MVTILFSIGSSKGCCVMSSISLSVAFGKMVSTPCYFYYNLSVCLLQVFRHGAFKHGLYFQHSAASNVRMPSITCSAPGCSRDRWSWWGNSLERSRNSSVLASIVLMTSYGATPSITSPTIASIDIERYFYNQSQHYARAPVSLLIGSTLGNTSGIRPTASSTIEDVRPHGRDYPHPEPVVLAIPLMVETGKFVGGMIPQQN